LASLLSPLVVFVAFFPVRWAGIPFGTTCWLLAAVNLPAIWLVMKNSPAWRMPGFQERIALLFVVLVPLLSFAFSATEERSMYFGHPWVYSEPAYMFARGALLPEDPDFAGMRMGYPVWGDLLYRGILAYLLDSPPMVSYIWSQVVWLLAGCAFMAGIVAELGGGWLARGVTGLWLLFGVNPAGYVLGHIAPKWLDGYDHWGDFRYTPWFSKWTVLNTMPLPLALLIAAVYVLIRSATLTRDSLIPIGLLALSTALFYPLLFPPFLLLLGAKALAVWMESRRNGMGPVFRQWSAIALIGGVSGAAMLLNLHVLLINRFSGTGLRLSFGNWKARTLEMLIVMAPLGIMTMAALVPLWRSKRPGLAILALSGTGACLLAILIRIPYYDNEYKFVFAAAIALAPLASIGTERAAEWFGRRGAVALLAGLVVFLVGPFVHKVITGEPAPKYRIPKTGIGSFQLRLDPSEPLAHLYEAIRREVPDNGILLADRPEQHYPTLTGRSVYATHARIAPFAGVDLGMTGLLTHARGYDPKIIAERRETLEAAFDAGNPQRSSQALNRVLAMGRPVALVLEPGHGNLLALLKRGRAGKAVYEQGGFVIWLFSPDEKPVFAE